MANSSEREMPIRRCSQPTNEYFWERWWHPLGEPWWHWQGGKKSLLLFQLVLQGWRDDVRPAHRINEYLDERMAGGIAPNRQEEVEVEGVVAHTISSPSVSRLDTGSFFDTGSCRFLWSRDGASTLTLTLTIAHITTVAKCQSVGGS